MAELISLKGAHVIVEPGWTLTPLGTFDISGRGLNTTFEAYVNFISLRINNDNLTYVTGTGGDSFVIPSKKIDFYVDDGTDVTNQTLIQWLKDNNATFEGGIWADEIKFKRLGGNSLIGTGTYMFKHISGLKQLIGDGLFDSNDVQLASWDELVNNYGLDIEIDYNTSSDEDNYYETTPSSLYYIVNNNENLTTSTKLVIPEGIINTSQCVFCNCKNLTSIKLPNSITNIGEAAFFNCTRLEEVHYNGTIEDWCNISFGTLYSNPMYYAESIFMNNNNIWYEVTEIIIPDTITSIGNNQFRGFNNITKITIPNNVENIGLEAFSNCESLQSIEIPNSVTNIDNSVFSNCLSLTKITLSKNISTIPSSMFINCVSLESIEIPSSVTSIGTQAFSDCTSLESIEIPNSVTTINGSVFYMCTSLKELIIPPNVTTINGSFFGLKDCKIYLPNTLQNVVYPFGTTVLTEDTSVTYNVYFNYSATDEVLFDATNILKQGTSKSTITYNIYTDSSTLKTAFIAKANSYTIINMYHLDGTEWSE